MQVHAAGRRRAARSPGTIVLLRFHMIVPGRAGPPSGGSRSARITCAPDVTTVLRHGVTTVVRGPHPGWRDAA